MASKKIRELPQRKRRAPCGVTEPGAKRPAIEAGQEETKGIGIELEVRLRVVLDRNGRLADMTLLDCHCTSRR